MEILINDEKLDFKLENEKILKDIINGIESWLQEEDLCITSMKYQDKDLLSQPQTQWEKIPVSEIDVLKLEIQSYRELRYSCINNYLDFTESLVKSIQEKNSQEVQDLLDGYPFLLEGLNLLFKPNMFPEIFRHLHVVNEILNNKTSEEVLALAAQNEKQVLTALEHFHRILKQILIESEDPKLALKIILEQLISSSEAISEVSILLQTGNDKEAMSHLLSFSDVLQSVLRIFYLLKEKKHKDFLKSRIGDQSFDEFYEELNNKMTELTGAFDNNDSVLIGDLLEYEIAPQMDILINFLKKVEVE